MSQALSTATTARHSSDGPVTTITNCSASPSIYSAPQDPTVALRGVSPQRPGSLWPAQPPTRCSEVGPQFSSLQRGSSLYDPILGRSRLHGHWHPCQAGAGPRRQTGGRGEARPCPLPLSLKRRLAGGGKSLTTPADGAGKQAWQSRAEARALVAAQPPQDAPGKTLISGAQKAFSGRRPPFCEEDQAGEGACVGVQSQDAVLDEGPEAGQIGGVWFATEQNMLPGVRPSPRRPKEGGTLVHFFRESALNWAARSC